MKDYSKELSELKAKYGTVYTLEIPLNDESTEKATVFLRKLDRVTFQVISKLIDKDVLKATESLINTLRVGGDDAKLITEDFDALRSASNAIAEMLFAREGSLKKN